MDLQPYRANEQVKGRVCAERTCLERVEAEGKAREHSGLVQRKVCAVEGGV